MKFDPERLHKVTFAPDIACNVSVEGLLDNVRTNIARHLPQVKPHIPNTEIIALACGGPSMQQTETELVEAVWAGAKVAAVNGAYQWCIDRNIKPSVMIMLDGREFNARFLQTTVTGCRYLLASQCHPKAFETCKDRDVTIWHAVGSQEEYDLLNSYYFGRFHAVTLGTTVAIRAISLLRLLGFQSFDCFGFDSCVLDGQHHAYAQPENDADKVHELLLRPRNRDDLAETFQCCVWHMKQVEEFQQLIRERGNSFRLNVRGPGILAAIMRIAAKLGIDEMKLESKGD